MELRSGNRKIDEYQPSFDPHLDIATVVFSHVECVRTRHNLAQVSKLWRDASKTAAAYPLRFDFDAFGWGAYHPWTLSTRVIGLLDNDEALSLPYERVVRLLGETANSVSYFAAMRGSVRLLKWTQEYYGTWSSTGEYPISHNLLNGTTECQHAAFHGHLPALKYLHENGCPWDLFTCSSAAQEKHWDCLQYAVDNKCEMWEEYANRYAEHLR
tara:strand:+ start:138 stop:776 length:639 start_codon:yes stop_codon:yes gene_type:complete